MTNGKVAAMTVSAWETELVRLDSELVRAKAVGVGMGIRLAMRTRLLHLTNKPAQEQEEAVETYSKKREAEDQEEQEQAPSGSGTAICVVNVSANDQSYAEQLRRRQEKEDKERKNWEDWQHWYARYLVAKKDLDDILAVIPSDRHVPTDCIFKPETGQEKKWRIDNAPPPPPKRAIWSTGSVHELPALQVYVKNVQTGSIQTCALDGICAMVRQGYAVQRTQLVYSPRDWIDANFNDIVNSHLPVENGYQERMKALRNPTDVRIHGRSSPDLAYTGMLVDPKNDPWWKGYDETMVTLLTLGGPVHGLKRDLVNGNALSEASCQMLGVNFVQVWQLYSHACTIPECCAAYNRLKSYSWGAYRPPLDDEEHWNEIYFSYIENVHTHRMGLLSGSDDYLKWGRVGHRHALCCSLPLRF